MHPYSHTGLNTDMTHPRSFSQKAIGCIIADNHRRLIYMKHRGDAPFHCSAPRDDDWQRLAHSQMLKCDSAVDEFKGAAGSRQL